MKNERIEWTRCWRESADEDRIRFLIIGDSIVDGSKGNMSKLLPEGYTLTAISTSKGVDDPYYVEEMKLFTVQQPCNYSVVYFNNGLHDHGQSADEYAENYERVINALRAHLPEAKFILGLSTPITKELAGGDKADAPISSGNNLHEKNAKVIEYNEKVRRIADKYSLPVCDAYSLLVDMPELKTDGYHYNEEGRNIFASAVVDILLRTYNSK